MAMIEDIEQLNTRMVEVMSSQDDIVDIDDDTNDSESKQDQNSDDFMTNMQIEEQFKHPLEHVWTLWYLENDRSKAWTDMQTEITSLDTVEDFWSLYYTIKTPSELKIGSDYSMFKRQIKPMWEDDLNKEGGRWLITINKNAKVLLDKLWLDILLMMIGEIFEYPCDICGAVVNIRAKSNKISLWTSNGRNENAILEIGHKIKNLLQLQHHNLQYQLHSDAMSKTSSGVKSIYTL